MLLAVAKTSNNSLHLLHTIAQTMGPEAIQKYVDGSEYIRRLAAAQGIDVLNLIKTQQQLQAENQQQMHSKNRWR